MEFDEKLRWYGFWTKDRLEGGKIRRYYDEIRDSYRKGPPVEHTQEKIRGQTNFIKIIRQIPLWKKCR